VTDELSYAAYQECTQTANEAECKAYADAALCATVIEEAGAPGSHCLSAMTFDDGYAQIAPIFCLDTSDSGAGDGAME
jgi:hypothetical protein